MSIVIVSDLNFRSQANHPLDLADVLSEHNQNVTLIAPIDDSVIKHQSNRGFKIIQTHLKPSRFSYLKLLLSEVYLTQKLSPELIIGVNQGGYLSAYLASRLSKHSHLVYYALELSRLCEGDRGINTRFQHKFANKADMVWSTGIERARVMQSDWKLKELPYVLPNSMVTPKEYPKGNLRNVMRNYRSGDRVVLYTSFLSELTAVPKLIESVKYWEVGIKLVLTGFGSDKFIKNMQEQIQALGLDQRVEYLGYFPTKLDVYKFLPDADLGLVMRSHSHAQDLNTVYYTPSKLLEYAAFGLPVICSDNISLLYVERERWGKCVNPDDPISIASGVNWLASNSTMLTEMGARARHMFLNEYCMEVQGTRLIKAMQSKNLLFN